MKECIVAPFTGDNPSSIVSLSSPGDAILSLGTSTTLLVSIPPGPQPPVCTTTSHMLAHPTALGGHIAMLCYKNGDLARKAVRDQHYDGSWEKFDQAILDTPPGNNGYLKFYFPMKEIIPDGVLGEFAFYKGERVEGEELPDVSPPPAVSRAICETQLLSIKSRLVHILPHNSEPLHRCIVTGGASANETICHLVADILHLPVYVAATSASATIGGALLAQFAWWRNVLGKKGSFDDMRVEVGAEKSLRKVLDPRETESKVYEDLLGDRIAVRLTVLVLFNIHPRSVLLLVAMEIVKSPPQSTVDEALSLLVANVGIEAVHVPGRRIQEETTSFNTSQQCDPELAHIDRQVQVLYTALESMTLAVDTRIAMLHKERNALAPIHRLPVELLCEIFSRVASVPAIGKAGEIVTRLWMLAQVSCHWWDIIKNTPSLWCVVDPSLGTSDMVDLALRRSGYTPLYISANTSLEYFFTQVTRHVSRWKEVAITLKMDTPNLRRLILVDIPAPVCTAILQAIQATGLDGLSVSPAKGSPDDFSKTFKGLLHAGGEPETSPLRVAMDIPAPGPLHIHLYHGYLELRLTVADNENPGIRVYLQAPVPMTWMQENRKILPFKDMQRELMLYFHGDSNAPTLDAMLLDIMPTLSRLVLRGACAQLDVIKYLSRPHYDPTRGLRWPCPKLARLTLERCPISDYPGQETYEKMIRDLINNRNGSNIPETPSPNTCQCSKVDDLIPEKLGVFDEEGVPFD
ncbi:hypothetical protein FRB99_004445 [Tulasnella sp. 403]|nr:hypothetical protein FRB99_004445 [Tulasnella sp. 403]